MLIIPYAHLSRVVPIPQFAYTADTPFILGIRLAVPIPIPIFMAGCINLHDIIVLSSNYSIPYLGKSVHVHAATCMQNWTR